MNQIKPDLAILHLSDLHFGPYLQGVSRIGEWSTIAAPHNYNLLLGMGINIPGFFRKYGDRLIVVVTGDITTAAEPPAYEAVNNYLRDFPFVGSDVRVGLKLHKIRDRMYIVPGNHDIWLYGGFFTRWKRFTNRRDEFLRYFREPLPNAYPRVINGMSVTLYTIDTNKVRKWINPLNFTNVLGRGEVGDEQIAELLALHANLSGKKPKDTLKDFQYGSSLKIALMHHHLALPPDIPDSLQQKLVELDDAQAVLNLLCGIGVRLVLCGHQHFPYQIPDLKTKNHPEHSLFLSCAGSTTQLGCDKNSFYVYEITDKHNGTYNLDVLPFTVDAKSSNYFFEPQDIKSFVI